MTTRRVLPVLLGLVPVALVLWIVLAIIAGSQPDEVGDNPVAEEAFVHDVEFELFDYTEQDIYDQVEGTLSDAKQLPDDERDLLIAAGYAMCDGPAVSADSNRVILADHGLTEYANQWVFINAAANENLCEATS